MEHGGCLVERDMPSKSRSPNVALNEFKKIVFQYILLHQL